MTPTPTFPGELTMSRRIFQGDIDAYARASGDSNPIHVDPAFAAATPFGGTIAHGMLVLAFVSELMTRNFGEKWLSGGVLRIRFKGAARPGDTLHIRAERLDPSPASSISLTYSVACRNHHDDVILEGQALVAP